MRYRFPRTHRRPTQVSPRRACRCFSATAPTTRIPVTNFGRSSQIVNTATAGTGSAIAAVVGKTILVTSPETRTISGLDIESGRQLWQTPWQDAYWVRSGATDGDHFVFSDYTGNARDPGSRRKDDVVGPPSAGGRSARSRRLECRQKRVVLLAKSLHRLAIGRQHHRFSVVLTSRLSNPANG